MKKIAVLFSNGTEEIEAITPVDILKRAGAQCDLVSIAGEYPIGSHGITVKADKLIEDFEFDGYDGIIIPGGMPGAKLISENSEAIRIIKKAVDNNKTVAAICAAPAVVLAKHGFISGKRATCYFASDFVEIMKCATFTNADVEVDGNFITANGPKSAMRFSEEICKYLGLTPKF